MDCIFHVYKYNEYINMYIYLGFDDYNLHETYSQVGTHFKLKICIYVCQLF
jgi:hypothetical protein